MSVPISGTRQTGNQLIQWTLAVRAQLPKKYRDKLLALCKHHPEVSETHQLTLSSLELRILWRCPVVELPRLLAPHDATAVTVR